MTSNATDKKVPVTILTGFLGAGKTTLMNNILNDTTHGMKFAVIENEFGEVGIDEGILSENVEEELIEVMNGCICCTVRGDLVVALKKLYSRIDQFDGIIIETTGLADPAPVCQTFFIDDEISNMYRLDSVITIVDAMNILERLHEVKPEGVENEAVEQVCFSDKILLNKIDLVVDEEKILQIETELKALNPTAIIQHTEFSRMNNYLSDILDIRAFDLKRVLDFDPEFLDPDQEHEHDSSVSSVAVKCKGEVNIHLLKSWMSKLVMEEGANLYRYKGVLAVKDIARKYVFQGVGMSFLGEFDNDVKWKKDEVRDNRFVFIGKNLNHDFYREGFKACLQSEQSGTKLRFPIGTMVEANIGVYANAKVIQHWDNGNAYRLEIQDEAKNNIWAPIDHDAYIRAIQNKAKDDDEGKKL